MWKQEEKSDVYCNGSSSPSGVLCTPWGFAERTICTPTPSEIPCHPRGHLAAALPTERGKSQPTVMLRLQLKSVKLGLRCLLHGDTWDLSVLRWRAGDSADISKSPAPDAVCSSWCYIEIIAELHHRNPELFTNQNMTTTCKAIPFTAEEAFYYPHSKSVSRHVDLNYTVPVREELCPLNPADLTRTLQDCF